jgi:hypothetical protein
VLQLTEVKEAEDGSTGCGELVGSMETGKEVGGRVGLELGLQTTELEGVGNRATASGELTGSKETG